MSTIEELQKLSEREDHVEFKKAEHNYPFAGGQKTDPRDRRHCVLGYVVALANERGGRLVLGMADARPHKVLGSDFAVKTKYMSVSIFVSEQRNYTMKNSVVCLLSTSLHVQLARHSDSKGFH